MPSSIFGQAAAAFIRINPKFKLSHHSPMKPILTLLLLTLAPLGSIWSQTATDLNEGTGLTHDSVNDTWKFSWWGRSGRTYFIQQSDDLMSWRYIPVIEPGQDGVVEWNFATNADKLFMQLKYTDAATLDPLNDDFDNDKISNWNELLIGADPLSDDTNSFPANEDSDGDGILNQNDAAPGSPSLGLLNINILTPNSGATL